MADGEDMEIGRPSLARSMSTRSKFAKQFKSGHQSLEWDTGMLAFHAGGAFFCVLLAVPRGLSVSWVSRWLALATEWASKWAKSVDAMPRKTPVRQAATRGATPTAAERQKDREAELPRR